MENTIEQLIIEEIISQRTGVAQVADKIGVTKMHLHYVLKGKVGEKRKLTARLKQQIEEVLGKEFNLPSQ